MSEKKEDFEHLTRPSRFLGYRLRNHDAVTAEVACNKLSVAADNLALLPEALANLDAIWHAILDGFPTL